MTIASWRMIALQEGLRNRIQRNKCNRLLIPRLAALFWQRMRPSALVRSRSFRRASATVNRRYVSLFREYCARWRIRIQPLAFASITTARRVFNGALRRLGHPTRRGIILTLAAVPALFLLYLLALVPFTPGIGDIRKARIDRPALIVSADGRVVDEFKPVNREWVSLGQISPYRWLP